MNNSSMINVSVNISGWPAVVACGVTSLITGLVAAFLGSKLIDSKYEINNKSGISITREKSSNSLPAVI